MLSKDHWLSFLSLAVAATALIFSGLSWKEAYDANVIAEQANRLAAEASKTQKLALITHHIVEGYGNLMASFRNKEAAGKHDMTRVRLAAKNANIAAGELISLMHTLNSSEEKQRICRISSGFLFEMFEYVKGNWPEDSSFDFLKEFQKQGLCNS